MATILAEWGFVEEAGLNAQCKDLKYSEDCIDCCCCYFLFSQPDFAAIKSTLELHCKDCGFPTLFLPKFHPELNLIKQCWCCVKQMYCEYPLSSKEGVMHSYVINTLEIISLRHVQQ